MESQINQQPTTNLPALNSDSIQTVLERNLPKMIAKQEAAIALISEITQVTNDDEAEDITARLAAARDVFNFVQKLRMEATKPIDELKDQLMEYERPLDNKATAKSLYNEKKKLLETYQQEKHDKIQRERADAAKRKELENHKVDLRAKILENLTLMVTNSIKRVDTGSKDYFAAATIDDFDKKADTYKGNKPKLKQTDYDVCFQIQFNMDLIKPDELAIFITEVKSEQTYDIWNNAFVEAISPILNEWRAKIPDLKKNLEELTELRKKNAEEADALEKKQKEESDKAAKERQEQLDNAAAANQAKIQQDADHDKMSNNFQEQAATQDIGTAGKIKLILKFTDAKLAPKGFLELVYQCMAHADFQSQFPLFQKRDKNKKLAVDEKGRPVYVDMVQDWINWWLDHCDGVVSGTQIFEDSKVTIRK